MLEFHSAQVRSVNSERAVAECLDIAFPDGNFKDCGAIIVNATLGHRLDSLASAINKLAPNAIVTGSSCCGVSGREGVGESMNEVAIMAISGPTNEFAVQCVRDIYGANSYEKGLELAKGLYAKLPGAHTVYLLCPGIDIANDLVVNAFNETFGENITIFGGTSSDNMRGLVNYQYGDGRQAEHDAWVIGIADPTLKSFTRASHGFTAFGEPMVVTSAKGNKIFELDGKNAWQEYTSRLGLAPTVTCGETIPIGALAEELPPKVAQEYGNKHILRVMTKHDDDGALNYPVVCKEGLKLWLTTRNEDLIFSEQQHALNDIVAYMNGNEAVAVFQTDCLARGRFLFNKVVKDEIIAMMHNALETSHGVPPWLGMYGFGEYTRLGGKNEYHNYSTSLLTLYREKSPQ